MDWWALVGVATVIFAALALDGEVDHPEWLQEAPTPVRVTVNAVVLAVLAPLLVLGLKLVAAFWQLVVSIALVGCVVWLLYEGALSVRDALRPGDQPGEKG